MKLLESCSVLGICHRHATTRGTSRQGTRNLPVDVGRPGRGTIIPGDREQYWKHFGLSRCGRRMKTLIRDSLFKHTAKLGPRIASNAKHNGHTIQWLLSLTKMRHMLWHSNSWLPGRLPPFTRFELASTPQWQILTNSKRFLVSATVYMPLYDLMH